MRAQRAFTLIELLVVIVSVAIVAVLLSVAARGAKGNAQRTVCANNLREINLGLRMYSGDSGDKAPRTPGSTKSPGLNWTGYKNLMKCYVGVKEASSSQGKIFACPADTFHYDFVTKFGAWVPQGLREQAPDFLSYAFNGGNARTNSNAPGIAGRTLASINHPARTVLVMEAPALMPYSWHNPKRPFSPENAIFNDARDMVSFVDGHVSYVRIYWRGNNPPGSLALHQDPPAGYDYQWSGD